MKYKKLVDEGSGSNPLTVYMYPNTTNDEDLAGSTAKDVFDYLASVLVNDTILKRMVVYQLTSSDDYPNLSASDKKEYHRKFEDWIVEQNRDALAGCHYLTSHDIYGGWSDVGWGGSFCGNTDMVATMGDDNPNGAPYEWVKNALSHEFLHTAIDASISEVAEMHHPDDLDKSDEHVHHDLGFIHDNSTGDPASPLGSGYEDTHALHGCTQAPDWGYSYHEEPTHCTTEGVARSVNNLMDQ